MQHRIRVLSLVICLFGSICGANSPHWQLDGADQGWKDEVLTQKYFHNSELQRQWAWHLLGGYHFTGKEHILDFGCGDGKITAEISHFIPRGCISGVDLSPSMITFASRCFPSVHYPNVSFHQTSGIDFSDDCVDEEYDLIYSFCVFHIVANPVQMLGNLREHLASEGRLLLVIPAGNNPAFFQAANETFGKYGLTAPWSDKSKGSTSFTMRTAEGCSACLVIAGLEPVSIVPLHTPTAFFNKQELVDWMIGTTTANWSIPIEKAQDFFSDVIDRMAELDDDVIDEFGAYYMKLSRIEVIAKRAE